MDLASQLSEEIRISSIVGPREPVRQDAGDVSELAESIREDGLIEPIVVRPKEGKFEVVAGARRLAACKMLGWRKIRCQVVNLDDRQAFEVALAENIARRTLNPIEEAKAFQEYVSTHGWGSEAQLAKKIGKGPWYISRRLRLLSLPQDSVDALMHRRINPSLLEEILRIEDGEMRADILKLSPELSLSSKDVRRIRRKIVPALPRTWDDLPSSTEEASDRVINRACERTVLALRIALHRLDEVVESVGDKDWILSEILMQQRQALHSQIDLIGSLSKRLESRQAVGSRR